MCLIVTTTQSISILQNNIHCWIKFESIKWCANSSITVTSNTEKYHSFDYKSPARASDQKHQANSFLGQWDKGCLAGNMTHCLKNIQFDIGMCFVCWATKALCQKCLEGSGWSPDEIWWKQFGSFLIMCCSKGGLCWENMLFKSICVYLIVINNFSD